MNSALKPLVFDGGQAQAAINNNVAYGRYWGALERIDSLHFEACYYQPIEWCIANGFARAAGMPDVFAHGMLSMAWLGRVLTNWVPQQDLLEYSVRFAAITHVGERITCAGKVVEKLERAGRRCVRVELSTTNQDGLLKLAGEAVLAIA